MMVIINNLLFFIPACLKDDAPETPPYARKDHKLPTYYGYFGIINSWPETSKWIKSVDYTCLYPHDPPRTASSSCDPSTGQFVPATVTLDCHHEPCQDPPPKLSLGKCEEVTLPVSWPTRVDCVCDDDINLVKPDARSTVCNVTGHWDPPSFDDNYWLRCPTPCTDPPPQLAGGNCTEVTLPAKYPARTDCICSKEPNTSSSLVSNYRVSVCNPFGQWKPSTLRPCGA